MAAETVSDKTEDLVFYHETGVFARMILGLVGAFFISMILKDLVLNPVLWSWSTFFLPFWIITIGGLSVCVPLFAAGLLGPRIRIDFDTQDGVVRTETGLDFGLKFSDSTPFSKVVECDVAEMDRENGPPQYEVFVRRKKFLFSRIDIQSFTDREQAQKLCDRIRQVLKSEPEGRNTNQ